MTYYVVRVKTPEQPVQVLVFVLDRNHNLMDQVMLKVGNQFEVISIQVLGVDWP
jgi:hypothetical protein